MQTLTDKQQQKDTARIEAFSDGIFCVAITLLAIEIGVEAKPVQTNNGLLHSLLERWPVCLAYVISFINVLLAWMGHHGLFRHLRNTDNRVMITNGLLLMLIALVPFPTKTLGLYFQTGAFKAAVIFYTGYFVLISFAFRLLWYMVLRNSQLLLQNTSIASVKNITKNENIGLVCNSIIFGVSFISPWTALVLSFGMWVYWICLA